MKNPLLVPEFREHIKTGENNRLRELCEAAHPADVAAFVSALTPEEVWVVLRTCDPLLRAEIFSHLDGDLQVDLSQTLSREDLAVLLSAMSADDRVDVIQRLPGRKRESVFGALARAEREDIRKLASFEEGTTGAVMTSDYVTLLPEMSAGEAISKLRVEAPDKETIYYAYVVDESRRLIGFVSLKDLILANPETRIAAIMHREIIFARAADDQEEAARMIRKYDLIALPVINGGGILVGIVTHDDAMDIIVQEQTEDIEKLMAIGGPHETGTYLRTSVFEHFRKRVVWIMALAALGLVSGFIVQKFEGLLLQFAVLATFMPLLADTGGNTGSQSATLVVRALALKEICPQDVLRVLAKEVKVALPLGLVISLLAYLRVVLFPWNAGPECEFSTFQIGAAIATALGLQVITATAIGALLPIIAARFKLDPAVVASPALTTVVDITGLLLYFVTVKIMLGL